MTVPPAPTPPSQPKTADPYPTTACQGYAGPSRPGVHRQPGREVGGQTEGTGGLRALD